MTSQVVRNESRSRGAIKGHYTKWLNDTKITQIYQATQVCNREYMNLYEETMNQEYVEFGEIEDEFYDTMPHSLHYLMESLYQDKVIEDLREQNKDLKRECGLILQERRIYRQLYIEESIKLDEMSKKVDSTYNTVDFDTYEGEEPETCYLCYDNIHKHTPVHKCKSCGKFCHSHCYLYLPDKSKCPMCRSSFF